MKIICSGNTLRVSQIKELARETSNSFQMEFNPSVPPGVRQIDLDLSETDFVDCGGLGTLIGLRNRARSAGADVTIRLLNPPQPVQRMVRLLHLDDQFALDSSSPRAATPGPQVVLE